MDACDPSRERFFPEMNLLPRVEPTSCFDRIKQLQRTFTRTTDVIFQLKEEGYSLLETASALTEHTIAVNADTEHDMLWFDGYGFTWSGSMDYHEVLLE